MAEAELVTARQRCLQLEAAVKAKEKEAERSHRVLELNKTSEVRGVGPNPPSSAVVCHPPHTFILTHAMPRYLALNV